MTDIDAPPLSLPDRERIYRRNFVFFLIDSLLFTMALRIIDSNTVIPDFVRRLTDSEILIGLSGSIAITGFTLPQLFIARYIVRSPRKKWWFVGPNIPTRLIMLSFAAITFLIGTDRPELVLVVFFVAYSLAFLGDGLVGVPWADLSGTSLTPRLRARMFGLTDAISGIVVLLIAPLVAVILSAESLPFPNNYAVLFGLAGLMFALSILPGLFFHELPGGEVPKTIPPLREFIADLGRVMRDDLPFRAMLIIRILTRLFFMSAPFYIGYATVELGLPSATAVPVLLAMQTVGGVTGALLYAWIGAKRTVLYIQLALLGAALLPVAALMAAVVGPLPLYVGFLVSGLATGGSLLSAYINWVVSYADGERRPLYVGLVNTLSAVVALIAPFIGGTIAQTLGFRPLFVVALVMALGALWVASRYLVDPAGEA